MRKGGRRGVGEDGPLGVGVEVLLAGEGGVVVGGEIGGRVAVQGGGREQLERRAVPLALLLRGGARRPGLRPLGPRSRRAIDPITLALVRTRLGEARLVVREMRILDHDDF